MYLDRGRALPPRGPLWGWGSNLTVRKPLREEGEFRGKIFWIIFWKMFFGVRIFDI